MKVEEFRGGSDDYAEDAANVWLEENKDDIEVIDIKYSISTSVSITTSPNPSMMEGSYKQKTSTISGILIMYKEK